MTKKDKDLLLKDLCARLSYGVQILYDSDKKFNGGLICQPCGLTKYNEKTCILAFGVVDPIEIDEFKPYLRPMSSMTEEEYKEYTEKLKDIFYGSLLDNALVIDWLNAHHFDYHGLIKMGLALEAPNEIYNN